MTTTLLPCLFCKADGENLFVSNEEETMTTRLSRAELDARMTAAGMMPLSEMLECIPMRKWITHSGINDVDSFEKWLKMRREEMLSLQATIELGDGQDNELYEWVVAHTAVFTEVLCNFQAARKTQ